MQAAERLAHLNPKAMHLQQFLSGVGSLGESEQINVAHATAGLQRHEYCVVRLLYVDKTDLLSANWLSNWLADKLALPKKCRTRMVAAVMMEFFGDSTCPTCKGNGYSRDHKPCYRCDSSGRIKWSESKRRSMIGTNGVQWRKYSTTYRDLLGYLLNAEHEGLYRIGRRLSG